ncbi:hypothetical protein [Desulfonatronum sp. SC1]|uniref:hypothetical protein n=1 Tax=Desulfonatronum sp. SC1 TaxID=2109626 RepID=UPI000D327984|nr:hypothetical protein [Desulfonatronum sp. SC1]PTN34358.1 hypothetical protein C6366_13095 [Desulfonatronum sp. SC1]
MPSNNQQAGDGKPSPASPLRRLLRLGLGVALIVGFIAMLNNLERLIGKSETLETLRERDIYVGAWYWDTIQEVSEAMSFIRGALGKGDKKED